MALKNVHHIMHVDHQGKHHPSLVTHHHGDAHDQDDPPAVNLIHADGTKHEHVPHQSDTEQGLGAWYHLHEEAMHKETK